MMQHSEPMDSYAIQVIGRMELVLSVLASQPDPMLLKDVAERSQLNVSTVHRILNDLTISRIVERVSAGEYKLGIRLLELGNLVKSRLSVRQLSIAPMRRLHQLTGQTVNLSVRHLDEIMYIERAFSERSGMQVIRAIGGRAPLHLTSVGKLFLATFEESSLRSYIDRTQLKGNNINSITERLRLQKELDKIRKQGHARDEQELELGVRCMAAGIYDDTKTLVAGLSISAPSDRIEEQWLEPLTSTALTISKALGYVSS